MDSPTRSDGRPLTKPPDVLPVVGPGDELSNDRSDFTSAPALIEPTHKKNDPSTGLLDESDWPALRLGKAHDGFRGGASRRASKAPKTPLPRARTLWMNSKNPR